MDFRHLKCMVNVADHLGFKPAAKKLHITQPALSISIKQLEQELGVELFLRMPRTVVMTEAGRLFYDKAKKILQEMDELQNYFAEDSGRIGKLRIGSAKLSFIFFLEKYLAHMMQFFPGIDVETMLLREDDLYTALESGRVDLIYNSEAAANADFHSFLLHVSSLSLAMHKDHPLARSRGPIELRKLNGQKFAIHRRNSTGNIHALLVKTLRNYHVEPSRIYWVDNALDSLLMVSAGQCVAFMPDYYERFSTEVVTRSIKEVIPVKHQIQWKKDNSTEALQRFLASVQEHAKLRPRRIASRFTMK